MKCIRCGHDSKYKERSNQTCPGCNGRFAFEPQQGAKLTDQAFQHAVNRVSGDGTLRWGAEHLYYELCRHLSRPRLPVGGCLYSTGCNVILMGIAAVVVLGFAAELGGRFVLALLVLGIIGGPLVFYYRRRRAPSAKLKLDEAQFREMLAAWTRVHGKPPGLIERPALPPPSQPRRVLEPDLADYSFDRAVICDRARTVDVLLANNFHFENNCAVLSIEGYPPGPFETVRTMLKRNPRLQVFALHDATVDGCTLAHRLASDPAWFAGQVPVTDVGLRPGQAGPFKGLWLPAAIPHVPLDGGIKPAEAEWLGKYALELAAIRPDQMLKRLFRAMNRQDGSDSSSGSDGDGGVVYVDGDGDRDRGGSYVVEDQDSFTTDASADDGGADSFG